ncbi:sodium/hydrogen exchanger 5 [Eurytemora carolleeae]|uniref:sodium/hydrogen exchanger 5 n=1 Tax=Eurytemora carolleeae TaxID=1294199 RepID=UPI000C764918|nr:sodium/hydrogen exchanger 5 [Eurytemora carolleeae]|eukprot:XP_023334389.1 sodium/hydrogen exchanger 5-like [Eurytemora affinis]
MVLCSILNYFRIEKIDFRWQAILILGGLRGAIANLMVLAYDGPFHEIFSDTTLVIIFVTVILNGLIAKPAINYFKLEAGEDIVQYSTIRYSHWEKNHVLPWIQKRVKLEDKILESSCFPPVLPRVGPEMIQTHCTPPPSISSSQLY